MCRLSVRAAGDRARKLSRLCVDGRHSRQLLELQAAAKLIQHAIDSSLSRPRKLDRQRKKKMIHELEEVTRMCYN